MVKINFYCSVLYVFEIKLFRLHKQRNISQNHFNRYLEIVKKKKDLSVLKAIECGTVDLCVKTDIKMEFRDCLPGFWCLMNYEGDFPIRNLSFGV